MNSEQEAKELYDKGYRQVSSKFRILARVDIDNLTEFMDIKGYPETMEDKADQYRRCYSKDQIVVYREVIKAIKNLGDYRGDDYLYCKVLKSDEGQILVNKINGVLGYITGMSTNGFQEFIDSDIEKIEERLNAIMEKC